MTRNLCFLDVESRSCVDLRTVGARRYVADPTTQLVSLVAMTDATCHVWVNSACFVREPTFTTLPTPPDYGPVPPVMIDYTPEVPQWLIDLADTHTLIGHNSTGFDSPFLRDVVGLDAEWVDTLPRARAMGLPGKLDMIGAKLLGVGKHEGGKFLPQFYRREGDKPCPHHLLQQMLIYNVCDVLITRALWEEVCVWEVETDLLRLHDEINERGVEIDEALLRDLRTISNTLADQAGKDVERLTGGAIGENDLRKIAEVKAWLVSQGFNLPSLRKEIVGRLIADPEEFFEPGELDEDAPDLGNVSPLVVDVLKRRAAATRIIGGKLDAASNQVGPDGRVRDMLVFYGAHTGRFTSRVVQLHNLTRGLKDLDVRSVLHADDREAAIRSEAARLGVMPDDVVASLMRPVLVSSRDKALLQVDYSAVEARGLAWIAGEEKLLSAFREDRDVYCEFGSRLYGRTITKADKAERQIAKIVVLGAGYGMGASNFALFAANARLDLTASGLTPSQCVEAYRDTYQHIAGTAVRSERGITFRRGGIWKALQHAAFSAVTYPGDNVEAGKCLFGMWRDHLLIQLPSGRDLIYRDVRIEDQVPRWGGEPRPTLTYWSGKTTSRKTLYGGLIVENAVQAICRDLMCAALLRLDRAGFHVVLHVHDEIVCEDDPSRLDDMIAIMIEPTEWSTGFPIAAEGKFSQFYGTRGLRRQYTSGGKETC